VIRVGVRVRVRVRVSDSIYAMWCKNRGEPSTLLYMTAGSTSIRRTTSTVSEFPQSALQMICEIILKISIPLFL